MKLSEISLKEFHKFEKSIGSNIYQYIDVKKSLSRKKTNMSTNPKEVSKKMLEEKKKKQKKKKNNKKNLN